MKASIGLLALIILLVSACTIEEAKPERKQNLVIASDFLSQKDLYKLNAFRSHYKGTVTIIKLNYTDIQEKLQREGWNTSIDCILLSHEYFAKQISRKKEIYVFPKKPYNYQRLQPNPLVLLTKKDSTSSIFTTLNELCGNDFDCTLEKDIVKDILQQVKMEPFKKKLLLNLTGRKSHFSTEFTGDRPCLTTRITFNRSKYRRKYFSRTIDFPKDFTCFLVVKHAKHHLDALELLSFLKKNRVKL